MTRPSLLLAGLSLTVIAGGAAGAQWRQPAPAPAIRVAPPSPRDVQEARTQHPAIVAEFGGAETGARGAYVAAVGQRVAAPSGLPVQTYQFTALNSAVENAFAVPGGHIYVTRQLMGLMNNEAELAFALGHEVGHVAARHGQQRQSAQTRGVLGQVLGAVLGSVVGGGFGDLIAQGLSQYSQVRTLRYGRNQEYQSDQLGIQYMSRAGYDPSASATLLAALGRSTALQARLQGRNDQRGAPEWAQTHPLSENRVREAQALVQRTGLAGRGTLGRDAFLAQINGMILDDDPAQGVIEGRSFIHPDLRLRFDVPPGFVMQNGTRAVEIEGNNAKAQFSTARFDGNLERYVGGVLQELTGGRQQIQLAQPQPTTINGIPALFVAGRAQTQNGVVDVSIMAYQTDANSAFHFIALTPAGQGVNLFRPMFDSLRRLSPQEAAQVRPRVIQVVTVGRGDTVQSLAGRMAYRDLPVERFLTLNGLAPGQALVPGQKVKIAVYGARR